MSSDETSFDDLDPNTLDPGVAKVIFATEWDDSIDFFRAVATAAGLEHDEFLTMLDANTKILTRYVHTPGHMTVEKSKPFVEISDMLALARLARYCFENVPK